MSKPIRISSWARGFVDALRGALGLEHLYGSDESHPVQSHPWPRVPAGNGRTSARGGSHR